MSRPPRSLSFEAFQPDSPVHIDELVRQRRLCGWGEDAIPQWCDMVRKGDRLLYWILMDGYTHATNKKEPFHPSILNGDSIPLPDVHPDFTPIGHIAFDWVDYMKDASLANRGDGTITLSTFFILRSQQGGGIGGQAMTLMEQKAKEELGCKFITLNCPPARVIRDDAMRQRRGKKPYDPMDGPVQEEWYSRRGYVKYKEELRYTWHEADGTPFKAPAVFMRKGL